MKKTPNRKMIGLFTLAGIIMFTSVILYYLGNTVFRKREYSFVMYFEESIKGLNVGSSVMFRGVEIGKVDKIDLVISPSDDKFSTSVFASLNDEGNLKIHKNGNKRRVRNVLKMMVERGLRAKLVTQSYLTGQLMIELEIVPNPKPFTPHIKEDEDDNLTTNIIIGNIIEIPTILSPMGELSRGLQDLPIREIIDKFDSLLFAFNDNMPNILNQTSIIATNMSQITSNINNLLNNNSGNIPATVGNLNRTIIEVGAAAKALRNFADYIERHPEALLKGKRGY